MGVVRRSLALLFPRGSAWRLGGHLGLLLDGLGDSLERVRLALRAGLTEALPGTATDMLPEWHEALGARYDPTQSLEYQRRMLEAIYTAFGGVQLNQLNAQMHKELEDVDISERVSAGTSSIAGESECGADECASIVATTEIDPYNYNVSGTVENDAEAARVASVIAHFAPLHLVPFSSLIILSDTGTAECGLDICGIAECGYDAGNFIDRGDCESATPPMVRGETVPVTSNATWVRDAAEAHGGASSYKLTKTIAAGTLAYVFETDNAVTNDMHGFLAGQTITKRVWIKVPSASGMLGNETSIAIRDYADGTWEYAYASGQNIYDQWQEVEAIKTIRSNATAVGIYFQVVPAAALNEYFYVDDIECRIA